jgi:antitoxin ParD1/3/4
MTNLALSFPDDLKEFIDSAVESGQFAGPNDVVASALYAYRDQVELERLKLDRLRKDIGVGIDEIERGEVVTDWEVESFLTRMKSLPVIAA